MHDKNITIWLFFIFVIGILCGVNGKIILFINITIWNCMQDAIESQIHVTRPCWWS